jgi:hypothetical protein
MGSDGGLRGANARDRACIALAVLATALPPLVDLAWNGWRRVFTYLAADTFYYLTVARNLVEHGALTFDQEHATNGFHPLWQLLTAAFYGLSRGLGLPEPAFVVLVFVCCLALLALGVVQIGEALRMGRGRVPALLPLLPVGLYALCMFSLEPRYGTLWSFANGMESALAFAAFGWALRCMVELECQHVASPDAGALRSVHQRLGLALAMLLLARLDHGLLALGAVLVYLGWAPSTRRLQLRLALGLPVALALAAYFAFNLLTAGVWLPVSGALKSSFPHPGANYRYLLRLLERPEATHPATIWRLAQILLPALIAALFLPLALLRSRQSSDPLARPLALCAGFVLGLAAYDFVFVGLGHQGHWYFPVSIPLTSLFALSLLETSRAHDGPRQVLVAAGASAGALLFFASVYHDPGRNAHYARFYDARAELQEHFATAPPKLVEYDDGIIAFSTGFPALSGLGFTADAEAVPWLERRRILWLGYRRGFDHIASLNYFGSRGLTPESSSEEIRSALATTFFLDPASVDPFDFEVRYLTERRDLALLRMVLRHCPAEPGLCIPDRQAGRLR